MSGVQCATRCSHCAHTPRLDALVEALTAAFASREPLWRDGPPASRGYRMFVHKERVQVGIVCLNRNRDIVCVRVSVCVCVVEGRG